MSIASFECIRNLSLLMVKACGICSYSIIIDLQIMVEMSSYASFSAGVFYVCSVCIQLPFVLIELDRTPWLNREPAGVLVRRQASNRCTREPVWTGLKNWLNHIFFIFNNFYFYEFLMIYLIRLMNQWLDQFNYCFGSENLGHHLHCCQVVSL